MVVTTSQPKGPTVKPSRILLLVLGLALAMSVAVSGAAGAVTTDSDYCGPPMDIHCDPPEWTGLKTCAVGKQLVIRKKLVIEGSVEPGQYLEANYNSRHVIAKYLGQTWSIYKTDDKHIYTQNSPKKKTTVKYYTHSRSIDYLSGYLFLVDWTSNTTTMVSWASALCEPDFQ